MLGCEEEHRTVTIQSEHSAALSGRPQGLSWPCCPWKQKTAVSLVLLWEQLTSRSLHVHIKKIQRLALSSKSSDKLMACHLKTVSPIHKGKSVYLAWLVFISCRENGTDKIVSKKKVNSMKLNEIPGITALWLSWSYGFHAAIQPRSQEKTTTTT